MFHYTAVIASVVLLSTKLSLTFEEDEVKYLPGLKPQLSFKHFAGYLNGGKGRQLFYWFFHKVNNSETAPVILWLNGGPGSSSILGLFLENGPIRVQHDGKTLEQDPYSWNKLANVIYLESPINAGFCYYNSSQNPKKQYNDDATIDGMYHALVDFFYVKFPHFKMANFYIFGESYCGIYIPLLARKILHMNLIDKVHKLNLKGFGLGNGNIDQNIKAVSRMEKAFYLGTINYENWTLLREACCPEGIDLIEQCKFAVILFNMTVVSRSNSKICDNLTLNIFQGVTSRVDRFNVFNECAQNPDHVTHKCPNQNFETYLNIPEVKKALHVDKSIFNRKWNWYNNNILDNFLMQYNSMDRIFDDIVNKYNFSNILMYNGDVDIEGDTLLYQRFLFDRMKYRNSKPTVNWKLNDQWSGFATLFDNGVKLFTVHGSGHMVPMDKPLVGLALVKELLNIKKLANFD